MPPNEEEGGLLPSALVFDNKNVPLCALRAMLSCLPAGISHKVSYANKPTLGLLLCLTLKFFLLETKGSELQ